MRVFILAMMLFLFNLSVVMVDTLGIYDYNIPVTDKWQSEVDAAKEGRFDPDISSDVSQSFGFGDFVSGFRVFVNAIFRVTFMGETLKLFGIDNTIANLFSAAGGIIYILGIAQFISNRGLKGMS